MSLSSMEKKILRNVSMAEYTSWRVGGPAHFFKVAKTASDLNNCLLFANKKSIPLFIIGAGTNLLVSDRGYDGFVVKLDGEFNQATVGNDIIEAGSAARLSEVARLAQENSLSGLEFALGIPGTIGGALAINAGAFGSSIGDLVESVEIYTPKVKVEILDKKSISFSYRESSFKPETVITKVRLRLKKEDEKKITAKMSEYKDKRKVKQQSAVRTAGSVFKNPEGANAGKLIEEAGCTGMSVGGARISEAHTNFIKTKKDATATDVYRLIQDIQEKVSKKHGLILELEVCMLGVF